MAEPYDLVIVGMGSGGIVAAELATKLGVRVAVVERDRVGGDCLWTGCVPSKALLASARAAHTMRHADRYGIEPVEPEIDTTRVWSRIHAIQQDLAAGDDSPERFAAMGVDLHYGAARLTGPRSVAVGEDLELQTRFILLCTGSRPAVPPVPGLAEAGFLTSENVFELEHAPGSLALIGGGPVSVEMAQAFNRLGVGTTLLQQGDRLLPRDEPALVDRLTAKLREEGVDVRVGVEVERVTRDGGAKVLYGTENGQPATWRAEEIFVGAGRRPNVEELELGQAGVEVGEQGVKVDPRMRTGVKSIYAVGDVAGRFLFTHSAGYEAAGAVRNMFFPGRSSAVDFVPWCTFCDPELAHAGLTEAEAVEAHGRDAVEVRRQEMTHSDRARVESATEGALVIVTAKGKLVGAHVLAPGAGELIHELALAIQQGLKLTDLASLVHVYPTLSVAIAELAGEAAYERARRYRFLVRSAGDGSPRTS